MRDDNEIRWPIPYGRQWVTESDIAAVAEVLRSDYLTQGPRVEEFERAFARYVGADYAVAVCNATAGLHMGAMALGVKPGQRVLVPTITFAASANCVRYCGGEVSFCDIDPQSYTLDIEAVERLLEEAPRGTYAGIVPVDFAGYPVDMERMRALADRYGLWVMEDACHAPGGYFTDSKGRVQPCGNGVYADLSVFSFHPVKHIATGEGGMVTTNSGELYELLKQLRSHGMERNRALLDRYDGGWYHEMHLLGHNYRMTDMQAALGLGQLKRAAEGLARRRRIAERYNEAFAGCEAIVTPHVEPHMRHAYHLYVIQVPRRLELYERLRAARIHTQVHYVPTHTMRYYRLRESQPSLPVAEEYYAHCLSLPMFPSLTQAEQEYVIAQVLEGVQ